METRNHRRRIVSLARDGPDLLSMPPHQRIQDDQSKDSADRQEQWLHDVKRFARRSVRYSKNLRHVVVTRSTLQQQRCILSHILTLQQTACARMVGSEWGFEAILGLSLRTCANFGSNQRLSIIFLSLNFSAKERDKGPCRDIPVVILFCRVGLVCLSPVFVACILTLP